MAIMKLGGGITQIKGSFAGNVFRHDNSGQHIQSAPRNIKKTPSTLQKKRRDAYRTCLNYIGENAGSQLINRWAIYANQHPKTNRMSETKTLTWLQAFLSINIIRVYNDTDILQFPPE